MQRARDDVQGHGASLGREPLRAAMLRNIQVMSATDERYLRDLESDVWVIRQQAMNDLFDEGVRAVATLVAGAAHRSPKVRAACVALMDHLGDERCCQALGLALRDASPLVRRHAVHAVGCQKCKAHPLPIDVVGALIERVLVDSSVRVRRVAAHQLGLQPHDPRAIEALERVIAEDHDAGLVSRARHALAEQCAHAEPRGATDS
jgi:HEAT repeat protein